MADKASDIKLADRLSSAKDGIDQHTCLLRSLPEDADAGVNKENFKGMEGLVQAARKHAIDNDRSGAALDVANIAQYQRMADCEGVTRNNRLCCANRLMAGAPLSPDGLSQWPMCHIPAGSMAVS